MRHHGHHVARGYHLPSVLRRTGAFPSWGTHFHPAGWRRTDRPASERGGIRVARLTPLVGRDAHLYIVRRLRLGARDGASPHLQQRDRRRRSPHPGCHQPVHQVAGNLRSRERQLALPPLTGSLSSACALGPSRSGGVCLISQTFLNAAAKSSYCPLRVRHCERELLRSPCENAAFHAIDIFIAHLYHLINSRDAS